MNVRLPDDWPRSLGEAKLLQQRLRNRVVAEGGPTAPRLVAGVDVHVAERTGLTWAAVALLDARSLDLVESALAAEPTGFPYVPGYLSFREIPAVLAALALLDAPPDLLMVDGQGIAHPRGLGIAAHLGVIADVPTVGVAKSRLFGRHDEPGATRGSRAPLTSRGRVIGTVLRTRDRVRPLYVSVGHRISLERAVELVLAMTTRYRLPEPTRQADKISRMHPG
jgi:deoxyribonuclease V